VSAAAEWHELEATYHYVTTYAPELLSGSYTEAKGARVQANVPEAAQKTTGEILPADGSVNQHNIEEASKICAPQSQRAKESGISHYTQRKLDWLARKAPEQLQRVQNGEVSVHRACIQAGHIKEVTPL
jgi:hypothetical protein